MRETGIDEANARLKRIETRMVRGFENLGAMVMPKHGWLVVEGDRIFLTTLSQSLSQITDEATAQGAKFGDIEYKVFYKEEQVCTL